MKTDIKPIEGGQKPKTKAEKIAALEAKLETQKARLQRLKAQETAQERRTDARRKIIVGAAVLAHCVVEPSFAVALKSVLQKAVTRDKDREAIKDLLS